MNYKTLAKEIIEKMEKKHICLYHSIQKETIISFIDDFFNKHEIDNDFDFVYFMNVIIKKINSNLDNHTEFRYIKSLKLPFNFLMIDEDVYLVNTINKYKNFLYLKLKSINGIPLNRIIKEIQASTSYQTENWLKFKVQEQLSDYYELLSLPSIDSKTTRITFKFENNKKLFLNKNLVNDLKENLKKGKYESKLVLSPKRNFSYFIKNKNLVFNYNKCVDKDNILEEKLKEIKYIIEKNKIKSFILDLRGNIGGNSNVIKPLITYLKLSNLNLITIVDRGVFSSGIIAMKDMIDIGSTIIGEEVGTFANGFGPSTGYIKFYRFKYQVCTGYFYQEKGDWRNITNKNELESYANKLFIPEIIKPDIIITPQIDDLKNGKDTILKYAVNFQKERLH